LFIGILPIFKETIQTHLMKKLLPVVLLAFILFGCNKSNDVEQSQQEGKKYDVTFAVSGFNQSVVKFASLSPKAKQALGEVTKVSAATDRIGDYVDMIYYFVTNSSGTVVNAIRQANNPITGNTATFGTISDKLQAGTYTAYIFAWKGPEPRDIFSFPEVGRTFTGGSLTNRNSAYIDTYAKSVSITVGTDAVAQPMQLERIVGGLEVQLEKPVPENITGITVTFQKDLPWLYLSDTNASATYTAESTTSFGVTTADKVTAGKKLLSFVANFYSSSTVVIRAYAGTNLLIEKTVPNVRCYRNQKTVLTGDLFAPATMAASFSTSLDPAWATSTTTPIKF
jgi:hypothetical protein